jgi:hypothetical protein
MFQVQGRMAEMQIQHRHNDGAWSPLQPAHHDPAAHDPERDWVNGAVSVCTSCGEEVRIMQPPVASSEGDTT